MAEKQGVARRTYSKRHATIATVRYQASQSTAIGRPADSLLIYIKATLTNDEAADVRQYADEHPEFPHEPTIDQFFDEAQWESYRKLGEHIGTLLFAPMEKPSSTGGTGEGELHPNEPQGAWPHPGFEPLSWLIGTKGAHGDVELQSDPNKRSACNTAGL